MLGLESGFIFEPINDAASELLGLVRSEEQKAWLEADVVFACAGRDLESLSALYGPTNAQTMVIPNGFAAEEVQYVDTVVLPAPLGPIRA